MSRLLLATPYLPHRRVGHGGGTAIRSQITYLARRHTVRVVSLVRPGEGDLVADTARELGAEVVPVPFLDRSAGPAARPRLWAARGAAALRSLARGTPFYVEKYRTPSWWEAVRRELARFRPDVLQCEYFQSAWLLREARRAREAAGQAEPLLVLSSHELGSLPRLRAAALAASPARAALLRRQAALWRRWQVAATEWADVTLCVTEQDRRLLAADGGRNCRTVPLGVDCRENRSVWRPGNPPHLLFVGSFAHRPNRSAALFLVDKVWPRIANYSEDISLWLVGRGSRAFLDRLPRRDPRVRALGFVPDLERLYRESRLFVAPLLEGGGIKIKVLEAMARGIPVVTTPIGAEGIAGEEERTFWLAPGDERFAAAVRMALDDEQESARRATRARRLAEDRFCWAAIMDRLAAIYERR